MLHKLSTHIDPLNTLSTLSRTGGIRPPCDQPTHLYPSLRRLPLPHPRERIKPILDVLPLRRADGFDRRSAQHDKEVVRGEEYPQ